MSDFIPIYGPEYTGISDPIGLPTLEPTWWGFDSEPGMDGVYNEALLDMVTRLGIYPFMARNKAYKLFAAQYKISTDGQVNLNHIAGFPIDDIEMLVLVGEYSSRADLVKDVVKPGRRGIPPAPAKLFDWPESDRIVFNKLAAAQKDGDAGLIAKAFAPSLGGQQLKSHWWFQSIYSKDRASARKFPVPGEFMGLGVRIFIDKPWGEQGSNPFLYSGQYCDTVFMSSGVIKAVIAATDAQLYPTYTVLWKGQEVTATPSDFTEYYIGQRCTILKDVTITKTEQTWEDEDNKTFGENWTIVPICFYDNEI